MTDLCDEKTMQTLVERMQAGEGDDISAIDAVLTKYPNDPRLHFLKGSIHVGEGNLIEGHTALSRAVEIAPDFAIARFQLGFFQLTSGESNNALKTWARLDQLPEGHYLKTFVVGLRHLIRDEIAECITVLQEGIANNEENLPLNNDMALIITEITPLLEGEKPKEGDSDDDEISSTSFILNQFSGSDTKH